jgi:hypothetical protein
MSSGAVLFARYAYPPNELGYCGPADAAGFLRSASGGGNGGADEGAELARRARAFDGAWAYLEILAEAAGIENPLDHRVVEAYWVGNDLLQQLDRHAFECQVRRRFDTQVAGRWRGLDVADGAEVPGYPAAHHSFHVFEVYPWVPLLFSGSSTPVTVLDRCRIRWGQVLSVQGDEVVVRSRPLTFDGRELALGPLQAERARWASGGRALTQGLAPGQDVSLHWDWVCDVLDTGALTALREFSAGQLAATNRWLASTRLSVREMHDRVR